MIRKIKDSAAKCLAIKPHTDEKSKAGKFKQIHDTSKVVDPSARDLTPKTSPERDLGSKKSNLGSGSFKGTAHNVDHAHKVRYLSQSLRSIRNKDKGSETVEPLVVDPVPVKSPSILKKGLGSSGAVSGHRASYVRGPSINRSKTIHWGDLGGGRIKEVPKDFPPPTKTSRQKSLRERVLGTVAVRRGWPKIVSDNRIVGDNGSKSQENLSTIPTYLQQFNLSNSTSSLSDLLNAGLTIVKLKTHLGDTTAGYNLLKNERHLSRANEDKGIWSLIDQHTDSEIPLTIRERIRERPEHVLFLVHPIFVGKGGTFGLSYGRTNNRTSSLKRFSKSKKSFSQNSRSLKVKYERKLNSPGFDKKVTQIPNGIVRGKTKLTLAHSMPIGSPAAELAINRKSVISRKHYGSVETLKPNELPEGCTNYPSRFKVEYGNIDDGKTSSPPNTPIHLENPEFQTRWYFKYFLGKIHQNYVGVYDTKSIFVLSVVLTDANNHNVPQYRAILWTRKGSEKMCLSYNPNKPLHTKAILSSFSSMEKIEKGPKEVYSPNLQKELLLLEEQEGSINFKFGVVYAKQDQKSDDEMLSNEFGSEGFNKFLNLLGQRIKLKGWKRFKGGLDTKSDTTGEETVFTTFEGNEIIFHVSTLLPHSKDNQQQLERKRHIGNDIVIIIYEDIEPGHPEKPTFQPGMFKSQFTHIFALVTFSKVKKSYRLEVFSEESVPVFGPPLRNSSEFPNHQEFRDFLLVKLINGEKAAFNTPIFRQKRERTLDMLLHNIYESYYGLENGKNEKSMVNRRAFSDVFIDTPKVLSKRKEENRQAEFQRAGQILKLNTIVRGDAPTNISASSLLKREPWEPNCFYANYKHDITCGDSFGYNLIVSTKDSGIYIFEEGCEPRILFDKSVSAKQLSVFEEHGIMVFLSDRGKDSKINVFRLTDFMGIKNQTLIRNRNHCKENKIEPTRGCHLYASNKHSSTRLKIAASMGRKLLLMEWKHLAYWSSWYPQNDLDTVEGFQYVKEISLPEVPQTMVWLDSPKPENTYICVGYKYFFDLFNESSSQLQRLYTIDNLKTNNILNIVDIGEEDDIELMLCHNRTVFFKKLSNNSENYEFHWNSIPDSIVCSFPYILGFTANGIEIRLAINGNIVDTIELPRVKLICAKNDIYFDSPVPDAYASMRSREKERMDFASIEHNNTFGSNYSTGSPPVSPSTSLPRHIYQISISTFLTNCAYNVNNSITIARRSTNIPPTLSISPTPTSLSPRTIRRQSSHQPGYHNTVLHGNTNGGPNNGFYNNSQLSIIRGSGGRINNNEAILNDVIASVKERFDIHQGVEHPKIGDTPFVDLEGGDENVNETFPEVEENSLSSDVDSIPGVVYRKCAKPSPLTTTRRAKINLSELVGVTVPRDINGVGGELTDRSNVHISELSSTTHNHLGLRDSDLTNLISEESTNTSDTNIVSKNDLMPSSVKKKSLRTRQCNDSTPPTEMVKGPNRPSEGNGLQMRRFFTSRLSNLELSRHP